MSSEKRPAIDWVSIIDEALIAPGNLGNVYDRFYNYSFLNKVLLRMQGVHEPVATRRRWQEIGRIVLEGAVAKEIIRPIFPQHKDERDGEEDKQKAGVIRFIPVRCIYALSDTDGAELPEAKLSQWDLEAALRNLDIKLMPFDELNGNMQGYSHGREIAVNPLAANRSKTLMHELGHVVLGHTLPKSQAAYLTHRGSKEFQAEATAYLAMNELGLLDDTIASRSRAYIQAWLHDDRPPDWSIRQVFSATEKILKAGRLAIGDVTGESDELRGKGSYQVPGT